MPATPPRVIDLRSDTTTVPTPAMRKAMAEAEVGDDVYGEDPTVNRLEERAAKLMGKEAAVFVASGTMANLCSALAWCNRGDELACGMDAHLMVNEMGAIATFGGIQMRALPNDARGLIDPQALDDMISPSVGYFPVTRLLTIENTHNRGNGAAYTVAQMRPLVDVARRRGLNVHMDGARIFNASVALGVPASELAAVADSVSFCLSKGLSCPVGSLVTGPRDFAARARRIRKMTGGGMRQAGILAAAGLVALDTMIDRLADDHGNARRLAKGLASLPGIRLDPASVETNIVYAELEDGRGPETSAAFKERGVLANGRFNWVRFVTHRGVTAEDIDEALDVVASVMRARVAASVR
jgi:threonine aldolase